MDTHHAKESEERAREQSRLRRHERKKKQQIAFKTGVWDRCFYQVPGKQRFCAQYRSPDSTEYCATHMESSPSLDKGKRIPCPVDPNHTVFEKQLGSHIKICNVLVREAQMKELPYYSKGINSGSLETCGGAGGEGSGCAIRDNGAGDTDTDAHLDEAFVRDVVSRVKAAHRAHVGELRTEVLDPPQVHALHRAKVDGGPGFRKGRHVLQQASIVGHMVKRGLLGPSTSNIFVEMGAGKGALGQAISVAYPEAKITMVERSAVRRKAENRLEGRNKGSDGGHADRARIDIRDLNMAGLPSLRRGCEDRAVVVVAKHLCGAATDLALRALLTLPQQLKHPEERTATSVEDRDICLTEIQRAGGVAIATCCHHACNWRDYTGRRFLEGLGFTARDFEVIRRVSAWISLEPQDGNRKNSRWEHYPAEYSRKVSHGTSSPLPPSLSTHPVERVAGDTIDRWEPFSMAVGEDSTPSGEDVVTRPISEGCSRDTTSKDGARDPPTAETYDGSDLRQESRASAGVLEKVQGGHDCCSGGSGNGDEHRSLGAFLALSGTEKASAARECKRLLDRGRQAFLEGEAGLRSEMLHFVEREVTPENALLLGF